MSGRALLQLLEPPTEVFVRAGHKDLRVTICSACGLGVFAHQPWEFTRRPHLGICHRECVVEAIGGGA